MGLSIFMAPNTSAIMGSVERDRYGVVSAFLNLTRNVGNVLGIAIPTAVVVAVMHSLGFDANLSDPDVMNNLNLRAAYVAGMAKAFQVATALMAVAAIICLINPSSQQTKTGLH